MYTSKEIAQAFNIPIRTINYLAKKTGCTPVCFNGRYIYNLNEQEVYKIVNFQHKREKVKIIHHTIEWWIIPSRMNYEN